MRRRLLAGLLTLGWTPFLAAAPAAPASAPAPAAAPLPAVPAGGGPDECVLNSTALKPQLSHDRKLVRSFTAPVVTKDSLKESIVLKDGVVVTFEKTGCARLGYSFTFSSYPAPSRVDRTVYLELATTLLNAVPTLAASPELTTFKTAVSKAKTTVDRLQDDRLLLPCGAASCELNAKTKGKLILSYTMAL